MDYTIYEPVKLPSNGKIYAQQINPENKVRSMTTNDEMKRLSPSENQYEGLCNLLDDCLIDKLPMSTYDMHIGDYEYLLHRVRIATYGPDYKLISRCPICGYENDGAINLDELGVIEYDEELEKYREFDLPQSKHHVKLNMQTPRMLDRIASQTKEAKRKSKGKSEPAFLYTLKALIDEVDGKHLDMLKLEDFINKLPMKDTNYILQASQKYNEGIGVDSDIFVTCDLCGQEYPSTFRFTSEFFGPTIDI